eukprot:TRINITY_DN107016_c0_g1_i1.p1 TRINITY_DN107016_c0_g1~~TRINITY_DN107016_c0_g1_i1.p1  ORF type:complete len:157 (-),score=29.62 TRINITY_DN107016_c0_g1_i1:38-487(-)
MAALQTIPGLGAGFVSPAPLLPASVGSENLASMPKVAERVDVTAFRQAPVHTILRMAGQLVQLDGQGSLGLKCSDGTVVNVSMTSPITPSLGEMLNHKVEMIGSKAQDGAILAACALPLTAECELGLLDDFVKMSKDHHLRQLFAPLEN